MITGGRKKPKDSMRFRNPRVDYYSWKMEQTMEIIEKLLVESESGVPVIVEGRKDEQALRRLGVKGPIHCLKASGISRFEFLDRLNGSSQAILLTDFDREGQELTQWLYRELSYRGIKSDFTIWRRFRSLSRTEIRSVEELPSFMRGLEAKSRGIRSVGIQHPR